MKIKETIPNINPSVFLEDYCKTHNIEDIDSFINPSILNVEPISNYDNMQEGKELLHKILSNQTNHIGIVQDCDCDGLFSAVMMYNFLKNDLKVKNLIFIYFHSDKNPQLSRLQRKQPSKNFVTQGRFP